MPIGFRLSKLISYAFQRMRVCYAKKMSCCQQNYYIYAGIHLEKDMSVPFGHTVARNVCLFEI